MEESAQLPMMQLTARFPVGEWRDLQILEMPYLGNRFAIDILLPRKIDGLATLEAALDWRQLQKRLEDLEEREVRVSLPRFRIESELLLNPVLAEMGMPSAFRPSVADFSDMDGRRDLFVAVVAQKTHLQVGERGTEAASATAVVMGTWGMVKDLNRPSTVFRADHPFFFLVRDREAGTILILGRFCGPGSMP